MVYTPEINERPLPWQAKCVIASGAVATLSALALYSFAIMAQVDLKLYSRVTAHTLMPTTITLGISGTIFMADFIATQIKGTSHVVPKERALFNMDASAPKGMRDLAEMVRSLVENGARTLETIGNGMALHLNADARQKGLESIVDLVNEVHDVEAKALNDMAALGKCASTHDVFDFERMAANSWLDSEEKTLQNLQAQLLQAEATLTNKQLLNDAEEIRKAQTALDGLKEEITKAQEAVERRKAQVDHDFLQKTNPLDPQNQKKLKKQLADFATSLETILSTPFDTGIIGEHTLLSLLKNPVLNGSAKLVMSKKQMAKLLNDELTKLFAHPLLKAFEEAPAGSDIARFDHKIRELSTLMLYYIMDTSGFYRARVAAHLEHAVRESASTLRELTKKDQVTLEDLNQLFSLDTSHNSPLLKIKKGLELASKETNIGFGIAIFLLCAAALTCAFAPKYLLKIAMTKREIIQRVVILSLGALSTTLASYYLIRHYHWRHRGYEISKDRAPPLPTRKEVTRYVVIDALKTEIDQTEKTVVDTLNKVVRDVVLPRGQEFNEQNGQHTEVSRLLTELTAAIKDLGADFAQEQETFATSPSLQNVVALRKFLDKGWYDQQVVTITAARDVANEAFILAQTDGSSDDVITQRGLALVGLERDLVIAKRNQEKADIMAYFIPSNMEKMNFLKVLPYILGKTLLSIKEELTKSQYGLQGRQWLEGDESGGGVWHRGWFTPGAWKNSAKKGLVGVALTYKKQGLKSSLEETIKTTFLKLRQHPNATPLLAMKAKGEKIDKVLKLAEELLLPIISLTLERSRHFRAGLLETLTDDVFDQMIAHLESLTPEWILEEAQAAHDGIVVPKNILHDDYLQLHNAKVKAKKELERVKFLPKEHHLSFEEIIGLLNPEGPLAPLYQAIDQERH